MFSKPFIRGNRSSDRLPRCGGVSICCEHCISSCFTIDKEKERWLMRLDPAGVVILGSMRQGGKTPHSSSHFQSFPTSHTASLQRHLQLMKRSTLQLGRRLSSISHIVFTLAKKSPMILERSTCSVVRATWVCDWFFYSEEKALTSQ